MKKNNTIIRKLHCYYWLSLYDLVNSLRLEIDAIDLLINNMKTNINRLIHIENCSQVHILAPYDSHNLLRH